MNFAFWLPVAFLLFLGFGAVLKHVPPSIPVAYACVSLLSAGLYASDKSKAGRGEWRTPECTLHFVDLLGGWPGGLVAQRYFRHKNRKLSFQLVFWLCALGHIAVWGWISMAIPAEPELALFLKRLGRALAAAFSQ